MKKLSTLELRDFINSKPKKQAVVNLGTEKRPKYVNARLVWATGPWGHKQDQLQITAIFTKKVAAEFKIAQKSQIGVWSLVEITSTISFKKPL